MAATAKGFVYIFSNPSMPGLLKVGMTTKVPEKRADELSTTGVPEPFEVQYYAYFDDRAIAEEKAHIALSEYHHGKEFFKVDIETVIHAVENVGIPFIRLFIKDQSVALNPAESKAVDELTAKRIELEKLISERMAVERSIAARIEAKRKEIQALDAQKWAISKELRQHKPLDEKKKEATAEWQRIGEEWEKVNKKKEDIREKEDILDYEIYNIDQVWKKVSNIKEEYESVLKEVNKAEWELELNENIMIEAEIEINNKWEILENKKVIFKKKAEKIIKQLNAEWKRLKEEKKKFTIVNDNKNNKLS